MNEVEQTRRDIAAEFVDALLLARTQFDQVPDERMWLTMTRQFRAKLNRGVAADALAHCICLIWETHRRWRLATVTDLCVQPETIDEIFADEPICECEFVTWKETILCDNPASWWGVNLCCGQRGLYCESCKSRADGVGDYRYTLDMCAACGGSGIRWTKL